MSIHPCAGKLPTADLLTNIAFLVSAYYTSKPDFSEITQRVSFGSAGHRGSSLSKSFNELHVLAIVQAICDYRVAQKIRGPLFLGKDTHALSESAYMTAIEVLAGNDVSVFIQPGQGYTPTPVISHAILNYNVQHLNGYADGLILTPSHNPVTDGGIKYNMINGAGANLQISNHLQTRANEYLRKGCVTVKRLPFARALKAPTTHEHDFLSVYIPDLQNVINMRAISDSTLKIAADALGGAGFAYWGRIAEYYHLQIDTYNCHFDPSFRFMSVDKDGQIRMDCSNPYVLNEMLKRKSQYDLSMGNDPDFDRYALITKEGFISPNIYALMAMDYLFKTRLNWSSKAKVGKSVVSSSMIDRLSTLLGRELYEVPVGFKWFASGLESGMIALATEESAGASFLRRDGTVWTTDKDGFIPSLLAAEIMAVTGQTLSEYGQKISHLLGESFYERINCAATYEQQEKMESLRLGDISITTLAGEPVQDIFFCTTGNAEPFRGFKVTTKGGWFAFRSSGTEPILKLYGESFKSQEHLDLIMLEAQAIVCTF